ncbi:hypothetical protein [Flexivirga caeni]|uniref:Uncharacterized protein n=1 Tax=Flexivirga caeni TaxID=2294115 RepID=A0A3M9M995_9MICO|nr:hypothetical protein [Flexivirga caeni]RNI22150.1 hypothetical protein EFY87_09205 [Flexivirga caeni]
MATFVKFVVLIVVLVGVIFALRYVRPKLHQQRMRRWEDAGLLPHQVDPYAPHEDDSRADRDPGDER